MANLYAQLSRNFVGEKRFAECSDGTIVSYAALETRSAAYANALVACGVGVGDRVAVQAEKSIDLLLLYLGCLRAGAVLLPLNTAYTAPEIEYFLRDAEPALFVHSSKDGTSLEPLARSIGVPRSETLGESGDGSLTALAEASPTIFETIARADDDLAAILYTSGTTGRSKGAMLSHGNLASNAFTLREFWRFSADDILLHALPIFHTHGLFVATNVTLAAGASMLFMPRFDPTQMLELMPRATVLMGVPTFYIRLLGEERFTADVVCGMRLFISGSAPLSADIHREFSRRTGHAILERYGMTETNINSSNPYGGDRVPGSVGLPLPGVTIRITDPETRRPLDTGEVGMIEIKGPNVFQGYWRMPEKTSAEFHDGFFMSGDLGLFDERGYLSIVGRAKDLIIAGGFNIYPAEVETALDELPEVRESAVIGVPHRDLGEAVVAVIVPRQSGFDDEAQILSALADRLARFKQPRRVLFTPALPKNTMGKVQKTVLRENHAALFRG